MKRMNLQLILIVLVLMALPVGGQTFQFDGTTYEIITVPTSWRQAKAAAEARVLGERRGRLAIIDSEEENQAVFTALSQAGITTRQTNGGNGIFVWLGGTDDPTVIDDASEGDFFWVDGNQFWEDGSVSSGGSAVGGRYVNWGFSGQEPDDFNGVQEYVAMALTQWPDLVDPAVDGMFGRAGEWNDLADLEPAPYVIEYADPVDPGNGAGACVPGSTTLCLRDSRFQVEVSWRDFQGNTGPGTVRSFDSDESGLLFFFSRDNIELLFKLLNGCGLNDRYWVFFAATTNVEFTITVTDTQESVVKTYTNPLNQPANAVTDTDAFATCP